MRSVTLALSMFVLVGSASTASAQTSFTALGDLPGGTFRSEASCVSANGSVVVGRSTVAPNQAEAFRSVGSSIVSIGDLTGGSLQGFALGVSADGSVIAGKGNGLAGTEAFKWQGGVFTRLGGTVAGGVFGSVANAINSDGSVCAGSRELAGFVLEACRWNGTTLQPLGFLAGGGDASFALGVSGDGTIVVGGSDTIIGTEAFRWTQASGMVSLGDLPGGGATPISEAAAISRNGTTIVGTGTSSNGTEAFRWTQATGMVALGGLPGGDSQSDAHAVSARGDFIVGASAGPSGLDEAVIWDAGNGFRSIKALLQADEINLTGWTLVDALGISDNGRTVVGYGTNPSGNTEAWVATIGCSSDFDRDGFVTGDDFDAYVTAFELGNIASDFDGDGFVTGDAFVAAFEGGC